MTPVFSVSRPARLTLRPNTKDAFLSAASPAMEIYYFFSLLSVILRSTEGNGGGALEDAESADSGLPGLLAPPGMTDRSLST